LGRGRSSIINIDNREVVKHHVAMKRRVVIVEDEEDIVNLVKYNMEREGYSVDFAYTGSEGLRKIEDLRPDLVILDIMLEDIDGFTVCRRLKSSPNTRDIPVIMLTAKSEDVDIITGLEVGADDYITKPFSPRVLLARVRALLRRVGDEKVSTTFSNTLNDNRIVIHGLIIFPDRYEVLYNGAVLPLSITEFKILYLLAQNPGRVFSRSQIISAIKGDDYPVTERSVDVQILGLRKKLARYGEDIGKIIKTIRGVGYKIRDIKRT